jgi:serine/threonine protein kinase
MHSLGVVHRDLKPENVLILDGKAKICDFGSSKILDKENNKNTPYVVSRYYRAPELLLGSTKYTETIDIWAVGCMLFELMTRTPLFPGDTEGMQVVEFASVLGSPSTAEFKELGKVVDENLVTLLKKFGEFPR